MKKIKRGWALSKKSWGLLNENRELLRFPLYGAVATIPLAIIFLGPGLYLFEEDSLAGAIPLIVLGIYVLSVVATYFAVGLAAAADMIFRGEQATVGDGLAVARSRFSQIAGWAALSTAISVVMGALENQGGIAGTSAARLVGLAWSLITFLAVPVIAIEGTGPFETLKRSASLFKSRWGQQITGNLAIGGAVFLLGILPSMLLVGAGIVVWATASFVGALLVVIGAIGFAISLLISQALNGIFGVALYRYALDGEALGGFTPEELESAVKVKGGGRNAPPTATPGTV
ncbi:MAG TPA: DUF6159 family protein [Solirubrobacterales bacterium]|nr:DUF6159 family protein [Solirubrobacterales bacterium]